MDLMEVVSQVQLCVNLGWKFQVYGHKAENSPDGILPCVSCTNMYDGEEHCFHTIDEFYDWLRQPME